MSKPEEMFGSDPKESFFLDVVSAIKCRFPERDNCAVVVEAMELWEAMVAACAPDNEVAGAQAESEGDDSDEEPGGGGITH